MPHYHIDKGVEMPGNQRSSRHFKNLDLYELLDKTEIGDSFSMPSTRRASIESALARLKQINDPRKFSIRKEDTVSIRVWRVK